MVTVPTKAWGSDPPEAMEGIGTDVAKQSGGGKVGSGVGVGVGGGAGVGVSVGVG